jgi:sialic acid synthase SpsE
MHEKEISHRNKHGKSVVLKVPVKAGAVLVADMLACKSPGHGIPPYRLHEVIGKKVNADLPPDTVLLDSHLV